MTDRGQLYTLEGIFAGLIILLGLFFAIQAVSTTPGSAGASNPGAIQSDDTFAQDTLASMNHSVLTNATLYWNETEEGFHHSSAEGYYTGSWNNSTGGAINTSSDHPPPNKFGRLLEQRLGGQYSYNVHLVHNASGTPESTRMVYQGEPGVGAVSASTSVVLINDDELLDQHGEQSGTNVTESTAFYVEGNGNTDPYNVVHVEMVIWQA